MRLRALTLMSAFLTLSIPALADTVYTYTGNDFTVVYPVPGTTYTTSDSVTGSFTLSSPLGDNLAYAQITAPPVFSFTDGINHFDNSDTFDFEQFFVATNASGQITTWQVNLEIYGGGQFPEILTSTAPGDVEDFGIMTNSPADFGYNNSPGTWTSAPVTATTPEPSSLLLLATGVLGLAGATRRKLLNA